MPEREANSHRSTAEPKPAKKRRTHTDTPPPLSRVEDKVGTGHISVFPDRLGHTGVARRGCTTNAHRLRVLLVRLVVRPIHWVCCVVGLALGPLYG